jgi:putative membrane protein
MRAVPFVALACVVATIATQMAWVWANDRYLLTNTVVLTCAAAATLTLIGKFGWRRGVLSALTVMIIGWLIEVLGVKTGFPFGDYTYISPVGSNAITGAAGHAVPMLLSVPLLVPCAWLMMTVPAYLTAQAIATGPFARLGWATMGLVGWDFFLDPQFVAEGWWHWSNPSRYIRGLPGIPVSNYVGWIAAAAVLIGLMWLLDNLASDEGPMARTPLIRWVPVAVYIWTWAGGIFANLVFFNRPASALWGGVIMGWVVVALLVSWLMNGRRRPGSALRDSRAWS